VSRSLAKSLHGLISGLTSLQSPTRRTATMSRLIERLELAGQHVVTTQHGPIRTLPLKGPHIAAAAISFHDEEPETLRWIDAMTAGEVLWDIGAASGLFSIYAALKGLKVFAFEPKATSFGVLIEHLALNDCGSKVFPMCVALSDRTGLEHLSLTAMAPGTGGNSVAGEPNQFGDHRSVFEQGVLAYRMDDLCVAFNLTPPDHIKIDVDGVEGLILKGGAGVLSTVKSVMMEVEGLNAQEAATRIEPPLFAAGLVEHVATRNEGARRNRLYRRP
jgi:FkbM family methyltransferase